MKELLEKLTSEMSRVNPLGFARFNKGILSGAINDLLRTFPVSREDFSEVLQLLEWRNGGLECAGGGVDVVIFPGNMLESLNEIIEHYSLTKQIPEAGKKLIPFINDFSNGTFYYDTRSKKVVHLVPDSLEIVRYKSMEDFLSAIYQCYRENVYFLNDDKILDCDETKATQIFDSIKE